VGAGSCGETSAPKEEAETSSIFETARRCAEESPTVVLPSGGTLQVAELDWGNLEQARAIGAPFDIVSLFYNMCCL
jgi:hypothetical protein